MKRVSMGAALYTRSMGDLRSVVGQVAAGDLLPASQGMALRDIVSMIEGAPKTR